MQPFLPDDLMVEPNFAEWEVKFSCVDGETLEGIKAAWQFLDSYRINLIEKSAKFESEKKIFESNPAKATEQIRLDLQLKFQCKFEELVNKLNEASRLLIARKQKIADQSQYISELEEKLKSPSYNAKLATTEQEKALNNPTRFELELRNAALKSAIEISNKEFQELVEWKDAERRHFENRINQLEIDVNQLNQERDQLEEIVQHLQKQQQSEKDHLLMELDFRKCNKVHDDIVSDEQLDQEEAANLVNLSSESSGCHSEADSNGYEVEDLTTPSEMHPLNSDENTREIFQVFQSSTTQYAVASTTYQKVINCSLRLEHSQRARAQAELSGACNANIHCLQSMQSRLKTFNSSSSESVTLGKSMQQLIKKWVQLDAKVYFLQQDVQQQCPTCLEKSATLQK